MQKQKNLDELLLDFKNCDWNNLNKMKKADLIHYAESFWIYHNIKLNKVHEKYNLLLNQKNEEIKKITKELNAIKK